MEFPVFKDLKILLASQSPRRRALLKELGVKVEIIEPGHDHEDFPEILQGHEIPVFLAEQKARACQPPKNPGEVLLTADTIVWLNNRVIGKPENQKDAEDMLRQLSGNMHEVFTGVCLTTLHTQISFYDTSRVYFNKLSDLEINFYLENFKPYDKAGSYGVQEWIGYIGIEKIEGSYFNVMGLPIHKVYQELKNIIKK